MELQIGNLKIGDGHPCLVIPEGCDNHHGKLDEAKKLAYAAKEAGAKIIKFQLHLPAEEMDKKGMAETSSEMFSKWGDLYGFIEENLLSVEDHAKLIEYCKEIDIQYFCTPFSSRAAHILKEIGGDVAYKIGSGETEDLPMIEDVANLGKPMIISTGMSTYEEIDATAETMRTIGTPFSFAHCISAYPPKSFSELHLGVIGEMKKRYGVPVGLSDHTPPEGIIQEDGRIVTEREIMWGAIGQGACFVEKHFTLDRNGADADSRFSHDKETLRGLINTIKDVEEGMDTSREVLDCERGVWVWAKRSLFASQDIAKGTTITRELLKSKRPGTGIRSKNYKEILGKVAKEDIKMDQMISNDQLSES